MNKPNCPLPMYLKAEEYRNGQIIRHRLDDRTRRMICKIEKGQRCIVQLSDNLLLAHVLIELYIIGAVAIPIDTAADEKKFEFIKYHSDAHFIIRNRNDDVHIENRVSRIGKSPPDDRFIIYTSGSTGSPKGVCLTKTAVEHNALAVAEAHNFGPDDVHATCLPLVHCNALMMSVLGCFLSGATLLLLPKPDSLAFFSGIRVGGATTASIVPALITRLVGSGVEWPKCLKYLITAAAPLSRELAERFFKSYGARIVQGYGLTEAVNFSFLMGKLSDLDYVEEYIKRTPPVGRPLPGTRFRIRGGEVEVASPSLMRGYWRSPELTSSAFTADGYLKTGDLGTVRGGNLVLLGRSKETINRGGESLCPLELEESLDDAGLVRPFAVVPVPCPRLGHDIGLVCESIWPDDVNQAINKVGFPINIVETGGVLVTITGKMQRLAMGQKLLSGARKVHTDVSDDRAASNESPCEIWASVRELIQSFLTVRQMEEVVWYSNYGLEGLDVDPGKEAGAHVSIAHRGLSSPDLVDCVGSFFPQRQQAAIFVGYPQKALADVGLLNSIRKRLQLGGLFVVGHHDERFEDDENSNECGGQEMGAFRLGIAKKMLEARFKKWGYIALIKDRGDKGGIMWAVKE